MSLFISTLSASVDLHHQPTEQEVEMFHCHDFLSIAGNPEVNGLIVTLVGRLYRQVGRRIEQRGS